MKRSVLHRIFLLSPAYAGGERARMILRDQAKFPLARKLRGKGGAPIADLRKCICVGNLSAKIEAAQKREHAEKVAIRRSAAPSRQWSRSYV